MTQIVFPSFQKFFFKDLIKRSSIKVISVLSSKLLLFLLTKMYFHVASEEWVHVKSIHPSFVSWKCHIVRECILVYFILKENQICMHV